MTLLHKNLTPFFWAPKATARRPRELEMAVCVRGVFRLAPGEPLTPIEDPIAQGFMSGEQWAPTDPDRSGPSVRHDDFADWKLGADLLLRGTCHPPKGQDVVCDVAFGVGAWSKTLRVHGPRSFTPGLLYGGVVSEPRLFSAMPLTWENAYGGPGYADNPAGKGLAPGELPTVEDPRAPVTQTGQRGVTPASFLPLSSLWPARRGKVGKNYGKSWEATRAPFFSDDFDWTYFNAAPPDQRLEGYLRGDEAVWFQHLHPKAPRFEAKLPGLRLRAVVKRTDGTVHDLQLVLDTLLADTDAGRLELLWRGHCPVTQLDLSDVKVVLVASEPLAEPPKPGAHWLRLLEEYEADPIGAKDKFPPGFLEVADAVKAAEKAELEGGPGPDFLALSKRLPQTTPELPPWAVAALGTLDDPLKTLGAMAGALGIPLPTDPAALQAIGERMAKAGKDPKALAEHLEALAGQLPPETGAPLRGAAEKLRSTKAPAPLSGDPATALEGLAKGLPPEVGGPLAEAAAKLRVGLADAAKAAASDPQAAAALAALKAPIAPAPPPPEVPLPAQLAALQAELLAATGKPGVPPEAQAPGREAAAKLAATPASIDADVGRSLAPLDSVTFPPPPDVGAIVARVVAGLEKDEALWRRRLGDHPLLLIFALAKRVTTRAGEQVARAKGPDAGAAAAGLDAAAKALTGLGVSAASLAPLLRLKERLTAFFAALSSGGRPPSPPRDFAEQELEGRDFSGQELAGKSFARAKLAGARFVGARLAGADLSGADLSDADLSGADLAAANLRGAQAPRARFAGARLEGADLDGADLAKADLTGVLGEGARLGGASLDDAVLEGARLARADLAGATLTKARLRGADLSGAILEQVIATKADLREAKLVGSRLQMIDLGKADLRGADLSKADLGMASIGKAKADGLVLAGASFDMAQLTGSRLRGADLRGARSTMGSLAGCDLSQADLRGLTLVKGSFAGALLEETDLTGATLTECSLRDVKATRAKFVDVKARQASATGEAVFDACDLRRLDAERSTWFGVELRGCDLSHARLSHALMQDLRATDTNFFAATMKCVVLRKARLRRVRFVKADLGKAELVGAELLDVQFTGANLWDAKFIEATLASCDFLEAGLVRARFDRARGEVP